jgi:sulfur-oxidizing protein SoxX
MSNKPWYRFTFAGLLLASAATVWAADPPKPPTGQELAFDSRRGNCLACHAMPTEPKAVTSTNIAPPLIAMKDRFPDRKKLFDKIWDATLSSPNTAMPPFGKHGALKSEEINLIIDYIYGL